MTAEMLWKATRPNGTDWWTGTVNYRAALHTGKTLSHPVGFLADFSAAGYFSASTVPTECVGMSWPSAAFRVEPVGPTANDTDIRTKVRCVGLRVVEEVPGHLLLGPQGEEVAAMIDRAHRLTQDQIERLREAAWDAAARSVAGDAARNAAWAAAREAAWDIARYSARSAALDPDYYPATAAADAVADVVAATLTRDLIGHHGYTQAHHDVLMRPWRDVMGSDTGRAGGA